MWLRRPMQRPGRCVVCRLLFGSFRPFSPSAASGRGDAPAPPARPAHFMVDFLASSCGLSRLEARGKSRCFSHLKSAKNPEAVLRLLRQAGLGDDHIRIAVLRYPRVLLCEPERTLEPKIKALQGAGFSESAVAQLISLNPQIIHTRDLLHRLEFWRKLIGSDGDVVKALKRELRLFIYSIDSKVVPRISLLRDLGIPDDKMGKLIVRKPRWLFVRSAWLKALVDKVKGLGFTPGSPMFVHAMVFIGNLSKSTMEAKSKILRSYGWTQAELMSAIHKCPAIMVFSEKRIHTMMCFLLNEAGCEPSYVARRPALLGLSIERRLMPRNVVLQSLKKTGLSSSIKDFWTTMRLSDDKFVQKFIVPYKEQIPELLEAHHAILSSHVKTQH